MFLVERSWPTHLTKKNRRALLGNAHESNALIGYWVTKLLEDPLANWEVSDGHVDCLRITYCGPFDYYGCKNLHCHLTWPAVS